MNGITKWCDCPFFHREIWSTYRLATRFPIYGLLTMYLCTKVSWKETLACQNNRGERFITLTGYLTHFWILEFIFLALEAVSGEPLPALIAVFLFSPFQMPAELKFTPSSQIKSNEGKKWNSVCKTQVFNARKEGLINLNVTYHPRAFQLLHLHSWELLCFVLIFLYICINISINKRNVIVRLPLTLSDG